MARPKTQSDIAFRERYYINEITGCWIWSGMTDKNGYGILQISKERQSDGSYKRIRERAPRFAWKMYQGDIPEGFHVLHRCDNPQCVNPEHLFLGTPGDNSKDMAAKGRSARGERQGLVKLTEEQVLEIRNTAGTLKEIAAKYGVSTGAIDDIKHRKTWKHLPGGRIDNPKRNQGKRGSENTSAKLTESDIPVIRARYAAGERLWEIAEDYGITDVMVSRICSRKAWGHIP